MRRCRSLRWYTRLVRVRIALWIHHYRRLDVHLYSSLPLSLIVRLGDKGVVVLHQFFYFYLFSEGPHGARLPSFRHKVP